MIGIGKRTRQGTGPGRRRCQFSYKGIKDRKQILMAFGI